MRKTSSIEKARLSHTSLPLWCSARKVRVDVTRGKSPKRPTVTLGVVSHIQFRSSSLTKLSFQLGIKSIEHLEQNASFQFFWISFTGWTKKKRVCFHKACSLKTKQHQFYFIWQLKLPHTVWLKSHFVFQKYLLFSSLCSYWSTRVHAQIILDICHWLKPPWSMFSMSKDGSVFCKTSTSTSWHKTRQYPPIAPSVYCIHKGYTRGILRNEFIWNWTSK